MVQRNSYEWQTLVRCPISIDNAAAGFLLTTASHDGMHGCSVLLEEGYDEAVANRLRKMGHEIQAGIGGRGHQIFGRGQIIRRNPATGVLAGGSDPRADGQVLGW